MIFSEELIELERRLEQALLERYTLVSFLKWLTIMLAKNTRTDEEVAIKTVSLISWLSLLMNS